MNIEAKTSKRTRRVVIVLVLSIMGSCILLGGALYAKSQQDNSLRAGLIEGCKTNGNPLRAAVRGILEDEIAQSESADLEKFFPQIPPEELEKLIREQNEKREERIAQLQPVNCEAQYK